MKKSQLLAMLVVMVLLVSSISIAGAYLSGPDSWALVEVERAEKLGFEDFDGAAYQDNASAQLIQTAVQKILTASAQAYGAELKDDAYKSCVPTFTIERIS